jgi:hypothetical protein
MWDLTVSLPLELRRFPPILFWVYISMLVIKNIEFLFTVSSTWNKTVNSFYLNIYIVSLFLFSTVHISFFPFVEVFCLLSGNRFSTKHKSTLIRDFLFTLVEPSFSVLVRTFHSWNLRAHPVLIISRSLFTILFLLSHILRINISSL